MTGEINPRSVERKVVQRTTPPTKTQVLMAHAVSLGYHPRTLFGKRLFKHETSQTVQEQIMTKALLKRTRKALRKATEENARVQAANNSTQN